MSDPMPPVPVIRPGRSGRVGFALYIAFGLSVGAALIVYLFGRLGATATWKGFLSVWPATVSVLPWFLLPLTAAALSWRKLFPRRDTPAIATAIRLTWIGLGVNWLLPVAMIGGELVKLRLATAMGWRAAPLIASLVADKTAQVSSQLLFTLIGLGSLVALGASLADGVQAVVVLAVFAAAVYGFYRIQHLGLFGGLTRRLAALAGATGQGMRAGARRADAALRRIYARRRAWWGALGWRLLFRVLLAFEIWLTLRWLGHPIGVWEAITLESLAQGARAAAFFVPAGIGAQEGGLVAAGILLGFPGEALLATGLVKRVRELIIGGAALLAWQGHEALGLWHRHRRQAAALAPTQDS